MEFWTVTLVSLSAGIVLVIGGALVIYMGSLVKSAYQLKIEIKNDVEEGQRRIEEEVEKKIRWVKRDLVEEVDKIKVALQTDNQRKIAEMLDVFVKRLTACETTLNQHVGEAGNLLESLRQDVTVLDQRLRFVRREQKAALQKGTGGEAAAEGAVAANGDSLPAHEIPDEPDIMPPPETGVDMAASGNA